MSLRYYSVAAYKYVREFFNNHLPSMRTMQLHSKRTVLKYFDISVKTKNRTLVLKKVPNSTRQ